MYYAYAMLWVSKAIDQLEQALTKNEPCATHGLY